MLSMTMAFAGNNEKDANKSVNAAQAVAVAAPNYDMTVNYRVLGTTLGLDDYQMEAVQIVHNNFVRDMDKAAQADAAQRKKLVKAAAARELQYMGYVLNDKQYSKFNTLLNLTLSNRGLLD